MSLMCSTLFHGTASTFRCGTSVAYLRPPMHIKIPTTLQKNILNRLFSCSKSSSSQICCSTKLFKFGIVAQRIGSCSQRYLHTRNIPSRASKLLDLRKTFLANIRKTVKLKQTSDATSKKKPPKSKDFRRLLKLAYPERYKLAAALGLLLISSSVSLAMPFGIGRVIDIIYTQKEGESAELMINRLKSFCKILLGVFLIGGLANFGRVYLMQTSGQRIIRTLREKVYASLLKQEVAFYDKTKTGELITRLSTDATLVGTSVTNNISDGLRATAQAIGGFSMMLFVSSKLSVVALSIIPPVAVMSIIYGRYLRSITKKTLDALADSTQVAEEKLSNIRTVRAFGQESQEMLKYNDKVDTVLQLSYKEALARGIFWGSTGLSGNLIILTVFYQGGLMMTDAQISVGELSSFLLYAAYVGVSMAGLSSFYSELMRGLGASSRLWQLMDRTPSIPLSLPEISTKGHSLDGSIDFKGVGFNYPSRPDLEVLNKLDLSVPQGKIVAVVGASGSGKSTLAALLLRFYDPLSGSIQIGDQNLSQLDPTWLRQNIGYVAQEPTLFSCSIADNIAYGALDSDPPTREEIVEAATKANALEFIERFPSGFDTLVGERGILLSGGQKQRIAIARAVLKEPKILLLDEATSALDVRSERLVQAALERIMEKRTVIIIAHRLSTIKNANQVVVLDHGRIAECGTYDELLGLEKGKFRFLVQQQAFSS